MVTIPHDDPRAVAAIEAVHTGDVPALERLLADQPELATARIADGRGHERTLLHVVADWPGHFPNGPGSVAVLAAAGADVNAAFAGPHAETPLHWAASSDDVAVLDALVEAGADVDAPGSVIDGDGPLADAVAFGQWRAARRLVEHGASVDLWQAAGLGLRDRLEALLAAGPSPEAVTRAFWCACHGGRRDAAARLLDAGADPNWVGYDELTPLGAAERAGAADLADWLRTRGAA